MGTISKISEAGLISTLLDVNSLSANNNYYITMTDLQDGKSKPFSSSALYWDSSAANLSITGGVKVGSNLVIESDGYVLGIKSRTLFEGYALKDIVKTVSSSDFANGTLVSTDIDSSVAEGITM